MAKKAIVLHSGGLDSTTALYLAKSQGFDVYALSFDYGQRHNKELETAKKSSLKAGVKDHKIVSFNIGQWGASALTNNSIDVPDFKEENTQIPVTYVPARNMIFLSMAASYAEAIEAYDIFIGVSQVDYSGYVDCREDFINSMENAINKGTVCAVEHGKKINIHAPFIFKTKAEEIAIGVDLGVDYGNTWSCYRGGAIPCQVCDSCVLRQRAFKEAGLEDPLISNM